MNKCCLCTHFLPSTFTSFHAAYSPGEGNVILISKFGLELQVTATRVVNTTLLMKVNLRTNIPKHSQDSHQQEPSGRGFPSAETGLYLSFAGQGLLAAQHRESVQTLQCLLCCCFLLVQRNIESEHYGLKFVPHRSLVRGEREKNNPIASLHSLKPDYWIRMAYLSYANFLHALKKLLFMHYICWLYIL